MRKLVRLSSIGYSIIQGKDGFILLIDNKTEPKVGDTVIAVGGTWNGTITQITGEPVTDCWKKIVASNNTDSLELKNVHNLVVENVHEDTLYSAKDIIKVIDLAREHNIIDGYCHFEYDVDNIIQSLGKKEYFIYIDTPITSDHLSEEDFDIYHTMYEQSDDKDVYVDSYDWSLNSGKGQLALYNFSKIVTDNNIITLIYK